MTQFDVFNGDADGLCALHQLRLEAPLESVLITGVKRDVALLQRVPAQRGDAVTVLDVSAATNHDALVRLLDRGVNVQYFDHHYAGDLPRHPGLKATIDPSPEVCTAMLVDRYLGGKQRIWAIVAAFGDNLPDAARELARPLALGSERLGKLRAKSIPNSCWATPPSMFCPTRPGAGVFAAYSAIIWRIDFPIWRMPSWLPMRKADTRSACARRWPSGLAPTPCAASS
jgi:hypothetical protein